MKSRNMLIFITKSNNIAMSVMKQTIVIFYIIVIHLLIKQYAFQKKHRKSRTFIHGFYILKNLIY